MGLVSQYEESQISISGNEWFSESVYSELYEYVASRTQEDLVIPCSAFVINAKQNPLCLYLGLYQNMQAKELIPALYWSLMNHKPRAEDVQKWGSLAKKVPLERFRKEITWKLSKSVRARTNRIKTVNTDFEGLHEFDFLPAAKKHLPRLMYWSLYWDINVWDPCVVRLYRIYLRYVRPVFVLLHLKREISAMP